eukprot:COSAG01_NODE_2312_length_7938_cov_4.108687_3_plen_164_part_00
MHLPFGFNPHQIPSSTPNTKLSQVITDCRRGIVDIATTLGFERDDHINLIAALDDEYSQAFLNPASLGLEKKSKECLVPAFSRCMSNAFKNSLCKQAARSSSSMTANDAADALRPFASQFCALANEQYGLYHDNFNHLQAFLKAGISSIFYHLPEDVRCHVSS